MSFEKSDFGQREDKNFVFLMTYSKWTSACTSFLFICSFQCLFLVRSKNGKMFKLKVNARLFFLIIQFKNCQNAEWLLVVDTVWKFLPHTFFWSALESNQLSWHGVLYNYSQTSWCHWHGVSECFKFIFIISKDLSNGCTKVFTCGLSFWEDFKEDDINYSSYSDT